MQDRLKMFCSTLFIICASFLLITNAAGIASNSGVEPPSPLIKQILKTTCNHDFGEDSLYSIKFSKNGEVFYHHYPITSSGAQTFPELHLELLETKTTPLGVQSEGIYVCTVVEKNKATESQFQENSELGITADIVVEPSQPIIGQNVTITCEYDIGHDVLYGIKFYKDKHEFYRYTPENSDGKIFPLPHVEIIEMKLNSVKLHVRDEKFSGSYACEVITDAPKFETISVKKNITIQSEEDSNATPQLKITPKRPVSGKSAKLECVYDTKGEPVYSFKMYKDNEEFYRYTPHETPTTKLFLVKGIHVDDASSLTSTSLVLSSVTPASNGVYTCEITTDAPFFSVIRAEKRMEVQ